MKKNLKYEIVNNQEDEDGDNLYFGYPGIIKNVKRESELFSLTHLQNKKHGVVKLPSRQLFVSDHAPAVKS
jgi:hypothetical protein